ncbi:MAG: rRNA maturation RNase YbeY, partial [Actinomyces sp.]
LNRRHLGEDRPTDVLAFPLDALDDDPVGPVVLGSVVVCPAVAAAQARDAGRDPDDELALLVVHGVLHVLGHDHAEPDETRRMRAAEAAALAAHHRLGS